MTAPSAWAIGVVPRDLTHSDIANALANIVRFAGKLLKHYSVAQHSILVAEQLKDDPLAALYGLAHDAHEYITGDTSSVVKRRYTYLGKCDVAWVVENDLDAVILPKLGLEWPVPASIAARIKEADARAGATEIRDLEPHLPHDAHETAEPFPSPIYQCWPAPKAYEKFLAAWDRYAVLTDVPMARRRVA